uniref:AMP-binding domain-containing protein n=1 Tax=Heterorhabditis bacteriophora TaxID=37862 RepID=A0A1I7XKM6_HETBA
MDLQCSALFSIQDLTHPGNKRSYSPFYIQDRIRYFKNILQEVNGGLIALDLLKSTDLVCVVIALVEEHTPFVFLPPHTSPHIFRAHWYFNGNQPIKLDVVGREDGENDFANLCYCIKTSGTTGAAKVVGVPLHCIATNIEDFRNRFNITCNDVVLFSTSLQFDPSFVEIFLATVTGACLLIVPDSVIKQPHHLAEVIMTVLGGEQFPIDLVNRYRNIKNPTKIFNVYGITEMSCWASVYEVKPSNTDSLEYVIYAIAIL